MRALLSALIRIAQRTGRFTVAEATVIYNGLWRILGFALFACVTAFMLNAGLGWKMPSLVLAIAFAIAAIYMWAKPLHILIVAGAGLASGIATDATVADEVENALKAYLGFLKWILPAGVTFLFITGTISFRENPATILPILGALGVVGLFTWMWPALFVGTWGRRLVYWYAVAVIAMSLGSLIPEAVWAKYTGWDPATVKPTATADGLYRLDKVAREMADADRAEKIRRVIDKVSRREVLTEDDKKVVAEARRSVNAKPSAPVETMRSAICPNVSAERTSECLVTSDWSNWIQFARGARDNGKQICFSFGAQFERKDENGVTFWRFRVGDGTQDVKYRLFPTDAKCTDIVL